MNVPVVADDPALIAALTTAGLPTDDLSDGDAEYWALTRDGKFVAFGGLVTLGDDGLLRSLAAVEPGRGHGSRMVASLIGVARTRGLHDVWLLTTGAEGFFAKHGFAPVARESAPAAIAATRQFSGLCPSSAILMVRTLAHE